MSLLTLVASGALPNSLGESLSLFFEIVLGFKYIIAMFIVITHLHFSSKGIFYASPLKLINVRCILFFK